MADEDIFEQVPIDLSMSLADFDARLAEGIAGSNEAVADLLAQGVPQHRAIVEVGQKTLSLVFFALNRLPLTSRELGSAREVLLALQTALDGGRNGPLTLTGSKSRGGVPTNAWERIGRLIVAKAVAMMRTHLDTDTKAASKRVAKLFNSAPARAESRPLTWAQVRRWFDDSELDPEDKFDLREAAVIARSMTELECEVEILRMADGSARLI